MKKPKPTAILEFTQIPDSQDIKIQDPQTKQTHRITPGEPPKQVDSVTIEPVKDN